MADSPLSALGLEQAAVAAERLAALDETISSVWSSDLSRAHATAQAIAAALDITEVLIDANLREAHAGEWQGLTHGEIDRDWPGYLEAQRRPPDFELYESVVARTLEALRRISAHPASSSGPVVVVAHSGLIRSLLRHADGTDPRIPNLGGVWIHVDDRGSEPTVDVIEMFDPEIDSSIFSGSPADLLGEEPGASTV